MIIKTLARIEWYLKEAVPLFILGTLILFLLHQTKVLALLERGLSPLITHFLGLPVKVTEAFIIGFLRRDYGAAGLFILAKEGKLDPHQILVSSGDDDPLHPLHCPILHDDQGEGIPENPLDHGGDLSHCLWGRRGAKFSSEMVRGLTW